MTVLIVRCDPRSFIELSQELSKEGLLSYFSPTTSEALSTLRQQAISCVVLDYLLAKEPTEFFRRYVQLRYPNIATVCIMNRSPAAYDALDLGVDFFVPPGFGPRDLALTVRYLLGSNTDHGPTDRAGCEVATSA